MTVQDPLEGVSTFVQVVEAGGFTAAAKRLGVTRSAVGKAVARLEARLGSRLLQRNTRTQTLTAEGQIYYERCTRALKELDAAEADLDSGRMEPIGRLRVSVPEGFGQLCVAPILLNLTRLYPQLSIDLSFGDRTVDLIEEGFDLAIRIGPLQDSGTLSARLLGTQHISIGASPAYLARHGTPGKLEELDGHAVISYSHSGVVAPWNVSPVAGRGGSSDYRLQVRSQISMDDIQAIAAAAVAGYGIAWVPCWLLSSYAKRGELVHILPAYRARSYEIHALWPQARQLRCKLRVAIDALVAEIPALLNPEDDAVAKNGNSILSR
ncbi:LysR family transcriptional regulator [Comamonas testosteroni]|uniref:LysR family transcriptional regulator n=1 Tax=Comamonas testosteroni TaxID=285 RepID=A0A0L7N7S1_COMTE|nr:LysR family transcriptional regulator [Comamonas testosteroni]KOC30216.1 LysR family transcriptional regulator [Comamonas testosteroni]KWT73055.1 Transcriptional regulator, LysR family [Comamonas testosteroni]